MTYYACLSLNYLVEISLYCLSKFTFSLQFKIHFFFELIFFPSMFCEDLPFLSDFHLFHPCINPTWPKIPRRKLHGYVVSAVPPNDTKPLPLVFAFFLNKSYFPPANQRKKEKYVFFFWS